MALSLSADDLIECYRHGIFPMADSRDDPAIFLINPDLRGIIPLETFHVPRRLARRIRQTPYEISYDTAFRDVIETCAEPHHRRPNTWINDTIISLYTELFRRGIAHSVEAWKDGALVGGLYGVHLGGAFFGESMFSRADDASKICLVRLAERLQRGGFVLLDAQLHNPHLEQFGLIEIERDDFARRLRGALRVKAVF
jgi:leucyl/phenylalanyl-tRNA--protein transferase